MTKDAEDAAATSVRGGGAYRVLVALVVGLLAGAGAQSLGDGLREPWAVDPLTRKVYVHSLTALLEPGEAQRLRAACADRH